MCFKSQRLNLWHLTEVNLGEKLDNSRLSDWAPASPAFDSFLPKGAQSSFSSKQTILSKSPIGKPFIDRLTLFFLLHRE